MTQGLYIVGTGPRSGKSIVVLGMMELLVSQGRKIGYFRPVAHENGGQTYYELRKHKGISEQMAFDLMADISTFGTMMVYHGHAGGMVSGAVHTTQHTIRPSLEII
jgi:phosphotransacetylase